MGGTRVLVPPSPSSGPFRRLFARWDALHGGSGVLTNRHELDNERAHQLGALIERRILDSSRDIPGRPRRADVAFRLPSRFVKHRAIGAVHALAGIARAGRF